MDSQQRTQPAQASNIPSRTANSTPVSSPGLFSPAMSRLNMTLQPHAPSEDTAFAVANPRSPFLHPLQTRKVRETYTANVDIDFATGRKLINQYEVMEEIGRGQHGKVKLARNTETGENVAIKIIPRYSKKRRLGKVTAEDPQRNTKREIAILKKIRHPNVVALLEVIDDPELKKIYMVLEHVEHGEITWRKKGLPHICSLERRLVERGARGEPPSIEEENLLRHLERRQALKEVKRKKAAQHPGQADYWSLEYAVEEDDAELLSRSAGASGRPSLPTSRVPSQPPSRTQSARSLSRLPVRLSESDLAPRTGDIENQHKTSLRHNPASSTALDGTMYGAYSEDDGSISRTRSPSMADSIISHMSSVDFNGIGVPHDPFVDDYSYVPCFTIDNARSAFRDTVLGLEYLHYNGVVHRDIKPANLLWTKDFRVKISDFGVSYFGRPVREGELDDLVSESEALDFDDDRELAKTVGTPAFFAPELCYTDIDKEPPKVSEQIDVWSLGVTLYCIIFARIPFLAEDEFSMFKKIATEDVYIPRRRLRPVTPFTDPSKISLYKRVNIDPYRDDEDAAYEEIDDNLYDLLRRMLLRNPEERIRLSQVKCHPWVVQGVSNIDGWMRETDPSKRLSGRQIEVDEKEIGRAVVPLTFLERAKSAVKKTINKVIHPRGDRVENASRRRAASSAASSVGEAGSVPGSAYPRDIRRKSLRGDDYLATVTQMPSEHPLSQSLTASPQNSPLGDSPVPSVSLSRRASKYANDRNTSIPPVVASPSPNPYASKPFIRHAHARSMGSNLFLSLTSDLHESRTVPPSPSIQDTTDDNRRLDFRKSRESQLSTEDSSRSMSVDRAGLVFSNPDKHAEAKVGISTAVAPGSVHQPRSPRPVRSVDLGSPGFFPRLSSAYQHGQPQSDSNIQAKRRSQELPNERPATAHRVERILSSYIPLDESSGSGQLHDRQPLTIRTAVGSSSRHASQSSSNDDESTRAQPPSRGQTISTAVSSSTSFAGIGTPLTSPSMVTSPIQTVATISKEPAETIPAFHSDPSLPALMSGASSISADVEGDFLGNPGVVDRSSLIATTDSLTPPAPSKNLSEFPLDQPDLDNLDTIAVRLNTATSSRSSVRKEPAARAPARSAAYSSDEEMDDDSDSDEGLMIMSTKKKGPPKSPPPTQQPYVPTGSLALAARRRDTNTSIGSTDTAKRVGYN